MLYKEKKKQKVKVMKIRLKKGDNVVVLLGRDRGKKGKIERVYSKSLMVLVSGVNVFKKHLKPRGEKKPGGIIDITKPLLISKVALVCPKCNQQTKIGYQLTKEEKIRICKKCKAGI